MNDKAFLVELTVNMTNQQLKGIMAEMYTLCSNGPQGHTITITGYGDDPRELMEIPEVIAFYKRLINLGFLSLLEVATTSVIAQKKDLPGIGALEIWSSVYGITTNGTTMITREHFNQFLKDYKEAHEICLKTLNVLGLHRA